MPRQFAVLRAVAVGVVRGGQSAGRATGFGRGEYVRDLGDERQRLDAIGKEGVERGVEASLNLNYRQLERDSDEAARVLWRLSVFAGDFDALAEELFRGFGTSGIGRACASQSGGI